MTRRGQARSGGAVTRQLFLRFRITNVGMVMDEQRTRAT